MKRISFFIFLLFLNGCVDTPVSQSEKSIIAKTVIRENKLEAEKARAEYIVLQKRRQKEAPSEFK
ncbi:MAG: hypothetical protein LGB58_00795 [Sulfurovum sp.]|nr:hypothetical protein [Sulfurovum sp.]